MYQIKIEMNTKYNSVNIQDIIKSPYGKIKNWRGKRRHIHNYYAKKQE